MIVQDIFIKRINWKIRVYHAVDSLFADEIIDDLIRIGCKGKDLTEAKQSLWKGSVNSGLTYSNFDRRMTVMVIGFTTNAGEYWNTLDHEKNHLLQHISQSLCIDAYGETISYISGEFIRDIYNGKARHLLCDCCRSKIKP